MVLTNIQWNAVVVVYYVSMLDTLMTIIGITTGAGQEGNKMFSWISEPSDMFIAMFLVNLLVIFGIITYMIISNESKKLTKYNFPKLFTYGLFVAAGYRLFTGPGLWILVMCGVPI
jgi:hypothetical protein